jgi:hypothetical protein
MIRTERKNILFVSYKFDTVLFPLNPLKYHAITIVTATMGLLHSN